MRSWPEICAYLNLLGDRPAWVKLAAFSPSAYGHKIIDGVERYQDDPSSSLG
jgi:hypothetical protein